MNPIERLGTSSWAWSSASAGRIESSGVDIVAFWPFLRQHGRDDPVRRSGDDQRAARLVFGELAARAGRLPVRSPAAASRP